MVGTEEWFAARSVKRVWGRCGDVVLGEVVGCMVHCAVAGGVMAVEDYDGGLAGVEAWVG